jgi:hypothetical protein
MRQSRGRTANPQLRRALAAVEAAISIAKVLGAQGRPDDGRLLLDGLDRLLPLLAEAKYEAVRDFAVEAAGSLSGFTDEQRSKWSEITEHPARPWWQQESEWQRLKRWHSEEPELWASPPDEALARLKREMRRVSALLGSPADAAREAANDGHVQKFRDTTKDLLW